MVRGWWTDLTDLVLPAECGGCGRARAVLCSGCSTALSGDPPRRVRPDPEPPGLPAVHAAAPYADEVRAALLAHKERGVLALTGPLGAALAGAVRAGLREAGTGVGGTGAGHPASRGAGADGTAAGGLAPGGAVGARTGGPVLLVPVPSARRAVRTRGHDPARRIALAAAGELRRTGTPARVLAVLRQRHSVADQTGLDARERMANLAGALAVAPAASGLLRGPGPLVLVDDLMTTGASLAEAARAVRVVRPVAVESRAGPDTYGRARSAVYPAEAGEGREERKTGPRMAARYGGDDVIREAICAAVVAAPPDSFEINRN
jgi:predicted amidophosphoribosyltransferase